jgi:hypothetical protein
MSLTAWTLLLPLDAPPLRDNDRMHWAKKARHTRELRRIGWALARQQRVPQLDRALIVLHWRPATVRSRDQLSIAPTLKPLVDGLIDALVLPDDDSDHAQLTCVIEPVAAPAALWLSITDLGRDEIKETLR